PFPEPGRHAVVRRWWHSPRSFDPNRCTTNSRAQQLWRLREAEPTSTVVASQRSACSAAAFLSGLRATFSRRPLSARHPLWVQAPARLALPSVPEPFAPMYAVLLADPQTWR